MTFGILKVHLSSLHEQDSDRIILKGEMDLIQDMVRTMPVDSKTIDFALDELAKVIVSLNKNAKKTRKDKNLIKKIQDIRDTIQDAVVYAKLKKSVE